MLWPKLSVVVRSSHAASSAVIPVSASMPAPPSAGTPEVEGGSIARIHNVAAAADRYFIGRGTLLTFYKQVHPMDRPSLNLNAAVPDYCAIGDGLYHW